jgi:DNA repair protein RadC
MRDKVIDKSAATLTELELLEMTFYPSNPRNDNKPMAKRLMKDLGSLAGVLRAPVETLQQLDQVGPAAIAAIKVTETAALHLSHSRVKNQSFLRNWVDVQDYCINRLAHERREHFIILCLDNQNRLISEEKMSVGTVNQTAVYTREVVNAALKHQAQALIPLHNHPSGEIKPSRADIDVTRDIEKAPAVMGIALHDHLNIADTTCVGFKSLGHLEAAPLRLSPPHFFLIFFDNLRVISPALRLAVSKPGRAAFNALPAASPAFFCTAGLRAAAISAVIKIRRNSILCVPYHISHKLLLSSSFLPASMLQPDIC